MKRTSWTMIIFATAMLITVASAARGQGAPESGISGKAMQRRVAFVGIWDRVGPLMERVSHETGVETVVVSPGELIQSPEEHLEGVEVVYLLNFQAEEAASLKDCFSRAKETRAGLKVIPLDRRDSHAELDAAGLLDHDENVPEYWRANGAVNLRRLLRYTATAYLGDTGEIEPPLIVPDSGYYHPDHPDVYEDIDLYRKETGWKTGSPVAVILMHQSFWITGDTKVINAEVKALEAEGFNVAALFSDDPQKLRAMILAAEPDILVEDRHGSTWEGEGKRSFLEELDKPYLRPISMLGCTIQEWKDDPRGLCSRDVSNFITLQETKGTIEPMVVGGLLLSAAGFRVHEPIYERIDRFAKRASSWVQLQRKKNSEKRVAIVYYSNGAGKDDLFRGSPTGAFLDGPESLARFLPRLKREGYRVDPLPADAEEILAQAQLRGRNIGPWAQGELEQMADLPGTVLVPQEEYEAWYRTKLDAKQREAVQKHFGPPPGKLMVVTRNDRKFLVLPGVQLGNVLLAPQPLRGEKEDEKLLHSRDVPPPHNYLCFYWWLQEVYHADAVLHWGTHGSLELLPGKEAGLSADDWSDLCVGNLPVINPWITDNIGEATLSRRRSYAALVDHVPPPSVAADMPNEMRDLHDAIDKFYSLEPGLLREEFRKDITRRAVETRVAETLEIEGLEDRPLTDEEIRRVHDYGHEVENNTTPLSLHILGTWPEPAVMVPYLVTCLGSEFLQRMCEVYPYEEHDREHAHERADATDPHDHGTHDPSDPPSDHETERLRSRAEVLLYDCVIGDKEPPEVLREDIEFARDLAERLRMADREVTGILHALSGGFIPPGPGPDPARNPACVPAGRNLYGVNPEEIPTRPSWEVAKRLIDQMLLTKSPNKVGFDLNGMNTMRDFGVVEGQILYLMGIRPVWDRNNLVVDVEAIPTEELGRPRVDVFIAMGGQYKENFGSRVRLLDKAVRLAASLDEKDNHVRAGSADLRRRLRERGYSEERAEVLSSARIFGAKPGNMSGTNILYLVQRSGVWESDDEINSVYIDNMSFAYTGEIWGEQLDGLYEDAIQGTDTIIRVWASRMTSQLSNHHAYEYLGGLSLAVAKLTGREPEALIADVRDPNAARMRSFEEVLATSLRNELLNPAWIEGMQQHDYAGAGHMAELTKNTFGWDVTRSSAVSDGVWQDIFETYVRDKNNLGLKKWFEQTNPHALQEITATMLEASRKGYWRTDEATLEELSRIYADSVARFGPSAGLVSGGNDKLDTEVAKHLAAPGDIKLVEDFRKAVTQSRGATAEARVRGPVLAEQEPQPQPAPQDATPDDAPLRYGLPAAAVLGLLVLLGFLKRPTPAGS